VTFFEAGNIEPVTSPAFAVVRAGNQPGDQLFVRVGRRVSDEGLDLVAWGCEPDEIEISSADQRAPVGQLVRRDIVRLSLGEHETIDSVAPPCLPLHRGQWRTPDRFKGPMPPVLRALGNPLSDQRDLFGGQPFTRFRRRHALVFVVAGNQGHDLAVIRATRNDGSAAAKVRGRALTRVEAQFRLTLFGVRAVTLVTVVGEDRAHIAVEVDLAVAARRPGNRHRDGGKQAGEHHCTRIAHGRLLRRLTGIASPAWAT
jgi:hypothetical protein